MFKTFNQKTRLAFADFWGIEVGEAFYCDDCGQWSFVEDEVSKCGCW